MAKGEFVFNIGDDNVVLTRFVDGRVANAWLGSPDPAMAHEELGEALAEDPKARISVLFDTLDQSFKEEEIPKVGVLDRRKVLARHINMAFPGANLRGARLVQQTDKKTLIYEMASVPLDGRVPGWLDFLQSLPNEKTGMHTIAVENVDIIQALAPKDAAPPEQGNHWRHLIGINVTGGLRQIIEKNGRLSLTRLTQAPPPDTSPTDFADMIIRDFKATITYIRRLGYQVGEVLDLIVLTTAENKAVLADLTWDGARSVSVYTPYEAGALLGLGSLGREDQAYCDVLHAAWFTSKGKGRLALTRAAALGDTKDDIRELAYLAAPYAAGIVAAAVLGWGAWTGYQFHEYAGRNRVLAQQLAIANAAAEKEIATLEALPYEAAQVRNVINVAETLDAGKIDFIPVLAAIADALETDATVVSLKFLSSATTPGAAPARAPRPAGQPPATEPILVADVDLKLAEVIATADEAVQTARRLEQRLVSSFGPSYTVAMTREPAGAALTKNEGGGLTTETAETAHLVAETFNVVFHIEKVKP